MEQGAESGKKDGRQGRSLGYTNSQVDGEGSAEAGGPRFDHRSAGGQRQQP